eukprot:6194371-Pleurochrysis_carterae.AAC.2
MSFTNAANTCGVLYIGGASETRSAWMRACGHEQVCVRAREHARMCSRACACARVRVRACVRACARVRACVRACARVRACVRARSRAAHRGDLADDLDGVHAHMRGGDGAEQMPKHRHRSGAHALFPVGGVARQRACYQPQTSEQQLWTPR